MMGFVYRMQFVGRSVKKMGIVTRSCAQMDKTATNDADKMLR